ncbi:ferritin-like domain-containing protein [Pusillimonas sp. DMV24BSW_D]|uniref:ferritin-like domain-containing protein n=1 Tax=Neopusillimonas aestuarii TaxID=2716226 RepID=UPI00140DC4F9|nr:ferritin-like domain-containing protein [Pusillimonas sp. DMV24BSW_D]QIM49549.1 ferritin-like domain-containing protein [Pusillimonas sp. DMV24BSW_D]
MRAAALHALCLPNPDQKVWAVQAIDKQLDQVDPNQNLSMPESASIPGRPNRPELVGPFKVKQRSVHTEQGRAALIHSLAHIEFNAINLALDMIWRFPGMPSEFYEDWLIIAKEEAYHFSLLSKHLHGMGYTYGDFPAHDGLWEMAQRTTDNLLARLALVPRTLEARGLDASPVVRTKLANANDNEAAQIIDIILRDEIGHVAIGNKWYRYLCQKENLDPVAHYAEMARVYRAPRLKGPFNIEARLAAGFTEQELEVLQAQDQVLPT